jgi:hypothetical protein
VCVCDLRSSVKEAAVLFNMCSLLHMRLLGSSCQWSPVLCCTGSADWYWWRMTNSMYSSIWLDIMTSHAMHSYAAGDLVLCKVTDTGNTLHFCHGFVIVITYVMCTANVEVHCTWNAKRSYTVWCQNSRMLVGIIDILKQISREQIVGWKCHIEQYVNM